jgi:hypothetical protein
VQNQVVGCVFVYFQIFFKYHIEFEHSSIDDENLLQKNNFDCSLLRLLLFLKMFTLVHDVTTLLHNPSITSTKQSNRNICSIYHIRKNYFFSSQLYPLLPKATMPKSCTLCSIPRTILIRCQVDSTQTWHFVCPGACWKKVSGGVEDAKGLEGEFPWYRYGGMVSYCRGEGMKGVCCGGIRS